MAVGGENIGRAYIKILADGRGLDKAIRDDLDDIDWDKNSRTAANTWAKAWSDQFAKSHNQKLLQQAIAKPLARGDYLTQTYFRGRPWKNFRAGLEKEYGEAGKRAGESLERNLLDGMDIRGQLGNILPLIKRMQVQIERDQAVGTQQQQQRIKDLRDEYTELVSSIHRYSEGEKDALKSRAESIRHLKRLRVEMREAGALNIQYSDGLAHTTRNLRSMNPRLDKANHNIDLFAFGMSRAFGKGSRNNFLNFMGSLVGNLARIPKLFTGVAGGISNWVTSISAAQGTAAKMGAVFGPLAKGAGGIAAAFGAIMLIIGPLIAAMSMLLGVLTALASTIVMGVIGAMGALAGSFLPVIAGIGVMIAAFRNMPPEAKRAFKSLKDEFGALGDAAGESMFRNAPEQVRRFNVVLGNLEPTVRKIGRAISRIGDYWLDALESPAFKQFRDEMERFMPSAVERLGRTMVNSFSGFGGVVRALIPLTDRFLKWIETLTARFAVWSHTFEGQNTMKKFFADAGDSAAQLGGFLKATVKLLGTIIGFGRKTGDSLFGSMTNAINRWNTALQRDPDILKRWFADAKNFGQAVGTAMVAVAGLIDALDNSATRSIAKIMIGSLTAGFEAMAFAVRMASISIGTLLVGLGTFANFIDKTTRFIDPFGGLGNSLIKAGNAMVNLDAGSKAAKEGMVTAESAVSKMKGTLEATSGAATQLTRDLIQQRLISSGAADSFGAYGIKMRDAVSAVLGLESAQKRVSRALAQARPELEGMGAPALRAKLAELASTFGVSAREVRKAYRETTIWADAIQKLPKNVKMKVSASGMPTTLGQFRDLIRDSKLASKDVKPLIKAAGINVTDRQLKGLIALADKVAKPRTHTPKVNAASATAAGKKLNTDLDRATRNRTANVYANTGAASRAVASLGAQLNAMDRDRTVVVNVVRRGNAAVASGGTFGLASGGVQGLAAGSGGMVNSRMFTGNGFMLGESGPEAVVPLLRPLSAVDPSVRWLSAIAQGKLGGINQSRTVDVGGITIVTPTKDPRAVAAQTVNELVGKGY